MMEMKTVSATQRPRSSTDMLKKLIHKPPVCDRVSLRLPYNPRSIRYAVREGFDSPTTIMSKLHILAIWSASSSKFL